MSIFIWVGFILLVLFLLFLDLRVLHGKQHVVSMREAGLLSLMWVMLSLMFNVVIYYLYENQWMGIGHKIGNPMDGSEAAMLFFTGYIIEKSLSVDNLFVISMIFAYFGIAPQYQHRILFLGILGAIVFRGIMILLGAALINSFDWVIYIFGAILIFSVVRMLIARHDNINPYKNPVIRLISRVYPISNRTDVSTFFVEENGKRAITMLLIALLVIEMTDVLFAVDSIPAIFSITTDPFIVFASNIFAILGLRALYFLLAAVMDRFRYLKMSLVFILAFVGVKMMLMHHVKIPAWASLCFILGLLSVGIIASSFAGKRDTAALKAPVPKKKK